MIKKTSFSSGYSLEAFDSMDEFLHDVVNNAEHGVGTQRLIQKFEPSLDIESPTHHYVSDPTLYFHNLFKNTK